MADGYIEFSTKLDNADLEKNLKSAEKSVQSLKNKIESDEDKKTLIEKQMERSEAAIHDTEAEIDRLKSRINELNQLAVDNPFAKNAATAEAAKLKSELSEQEKILQKQIKDQDSLNNKWQQVNDAVELNRGKLQSAEAKVQTLGSEVQASASKARAPWAAVTDSIKSKFASAGTFARKTMENAANSAVSPWQNFGKRVNTMLRKVFVFGMVLKGIRAVKSTLSSMLQENEQFNASVANLKAVTDGFLASMVQAVLPVFIQVVNTLAAIFERVAAFIDSIFGTGIVAAIQGQRQNASNAIAAGNAQKQADYDAQVAERNADIAKQQAAIDKQREKNSKAQEKADRRRAKSAEKLAKAQEKANQQILAFDEINALSAESSEAAADAMDDYAEELEVPEIEYPEEIEPPQFDTDWTQMGFGDTGMFQGILDWLDMLRDRIANDVEGPFARIREGLQLIGQGWNELVQGLMTGDWGLVWQGIRDMAIGALYVVEGALGAFIDWLDEITGGRFHEMFEGLKQAMHGVVEFIEGVLTGNLELAFQGLHDIVDGFVGFFKGAWDGLITWLDEITGGRFHDALYAFKGMIDEVWDGIGETLNGAVDFIKGVLTGDWELAWDGLKRVVEGLGKTVKAVLSGAFDVVGKILDRFISNTQRIWNEFFDKLEERFPQFKAVIEALRIFMNGNFETLRGILNGFIEFAKNVIGGAISGITQQIEGIFQIIGGLLTGNVGMIENGVKMIVNGVISIFEGFVNGIIGGAVGFLNGIISAANNIPGIHFDRVEAPHISLPRLAQGAVIPPNREFMAVLGDQKSGRNLEAPEDLIRQIVREESSGASMQQAITAALMQVLPSLLNDGYGDVTMILQVGNEQLAQAVNKGNASLARRGLIDPVFDF